MKRALKILVLLVLFSCTFVSASNKFVNKNNIEMSETEYTNLLNLGFTDNEIMNMKSIEFEANKDLVGTIVSQKTIDSADNKIQLLSSGYVNNIDKKTTISIISVNGSYRYKVTVEWKKMPSARSYDIMGIGIDPTVKVYSGLYFQINYCYTNGNCSNNGVFTHKVSSTGATGVFKLPSGSLSSMSAYLYFDVAKNTNSTITKLNAYGDYAHAMRSISLENAKKHSINRGGISLESSISSYYDNMTTATTSLNCNW